MNDSLERQLAQYLLQIKAIRLEPTNPFTWASGWKSPIYCDNRKILSYPKVRCFVRDSFVKRIREKYPEVDVIAGVATGAIAHGVLIADILGVPFIYVRSSAKSHGMQNLVEGEVKKGNSVVVIEDLISTGGSSLNALKILREKGAKVKAMLAIFSYGFDVAITNFNESNCKLSTLTSYDILLEEALKVNYVESKDVKKLKEWRKKPDSWGQQYL